MFGVPVFGYLIAILLATLVVAFQYYRQLKEIGFGKSWWWLAASFRWLAIAGLVLLFFNPWWMDESDQVQKPIVVVYTDASASISGKDSAVWHKALQGMSTNAEIRIYVFTQDVLLGDSVSGLDAYRTNLGAVVQHANGLAGSENMAGVVWMTDGIGNAGRDLKFETFATGVPVISVGAGDPSLQKDVVIESVNCNEEVFLGNRFVVEVSVKSKLFKSKGLTVQLKAGNQVMNQVWLPQNTLDWRRFSFEIKPNAVGVLPISIEVLGAEGDVNVANHKRSIAVKVVDDRKEVALVFGSPHPDISAMKVALESGGQFAVRSVYKDKFDGKADVMILHGWDFQSAKDVERVSGWLNLGKAVWVFSSPSQNEANCGKALNFQSGSGGVSRAWQESQVAWNQDYTGWTLDEQEQKQWLNYPPVAVPISKSTLKEGMEVLLFQRWAGMKTSVPLMVQWQSENGAVAQFFGEGLWRWRMQEKSSTGEAKVFDAWMRRTVGFLAMGSTRKKSIEIVMRENVVDVRDKSVVRVLCRDASGALDDRVERGLELVDESGVSRSLNLTKTSGGWTSVLPSVIEGTYLLKANCKSMKAVDEKRFVVMNQPSELLNTQANHDVLRDVSNRTGGAFLTLNRSDELNELMEKKMVLKPVLTRKTENMHWWNSAIWLLAVAMMFGGEWLVRRLLGKY